MKRTEFLYTEPDIYFLNGKYNKDEIIAISLGERLKRILLENGPNISIRIDAVKHEINPYDSEPFDKNLSLKPEDALKILSKDWYDYKITYEVNKEELE